MYGTNVRGTSMQLLLCLGNNNRTKLYSSDAFLCITGHHHVHKLTGPPLSGSVFLAVGKVSVENPADGGGCE